MLTRQAFGDAFENGGYKRTVRLLQRSGVNHDEATEIAQTAWVKGWECISQLREERFVVEWINTTAYRELATRFRKPRFADLAAMTRECAVTPPMSPATIDLSRALKKCNPYHRQLLEAFLAGYSNDDIATRMGKSLGAIHAGLSRARSELREHMAVPERQVRRGRRVLPMKVQRESDAVLSDLPEAQEHGAFEKAS